MLKSFVISARMDKNNSKVGNSNSKPGNTSWSNIVAGSQEYKEDEIYGVIFIFIGKF